MQRDGGDQRGKLHRVLLRLGWTACALLSLFFFTAAACGLIADLYAGLAEQRRTHAISDHVAVSAAKLATRIAPWKAKGWVEYAGGAAQSGDTDLALSAISEAIYWMPSDAEKWGVMAHILITNHRFNQALKVATLNVTILAPNSPRWQKQIAFDGIYWWPEGDDELRRMWLMGIRHSLAYDRDGFLIAVLETRREKYFCRYTAKALRLSKWCEWAAWSRRTCDADKLTQEQGKYCNALGFGKAKNP